MTRPSIWDLKSFLREDFFIDSEDQNSCLSALAPLLELHENRCEGQDI